MTTAPPQPLACARASSSKVRMQCAPLSRASLVRISRHRAHVCARPCAHVHPSRVRVPVCRAHVRACVCWCARACAGALTRVLPVRPCVRPRSWLLSWSCARRRPRVRRGDVPWCVPRRGIERRGACVAAEALARANSASSRRRPAARSTAAARCRPAAAHARTAPVTYGMRITCVCAQASRPLRATPPHSPRLSRRITVGWRATTNQAPTAASLRADGAL